MDKALTVLGEYRFWHLHRALRISPHFVRWGEIYPIFGPRLIFYGAALAMTLIVSTNRYPSSPAADWLSFELSSASMRSRVSITTYLGRRSELTGP
jgi:hypothetical protein